MIYDFYDDIELEEVLYDAQSAATNALPFAFIDGPDWNQVFVEGVAVPLRGRGADEEDGDLAPSQLEWRDDGGNLLGTGPAVDLPLSVGSHTLFLHVIDSTNQRAAAEVQREVAP